MSHSFRRFVRALLAAVMVIAMAPSQVFAASEDGSEGEAPVSAGSFYLNFADRCQYWYGIDKPKRIRHETGEKYGCVNRAIPDQSYHDLRSCQICHRGV